MEMKHYLETIRDVATKALEELKGQSAPTSASPTSTPVSTKTPAKSAPTTPDPASIPEEIKFSAKAAVGIASRIMSKVPVSAPDPIRNAAEGLGQHLEELVNAVDMPKAYSANSAAKSDVSFLQESGIDLGKEDLDSLYSLLLTIHQKTFEFAPETVIKGDMEEEGFGLDLQGKPRL